MFDNSYKMMMNYEMNVTFAVLVFPGKDEPAIGVMRQQQQCVVCEG